MRNLYRLIFSFMQIINKICFLLNWGREIDMFKNTYNQFDKKNLFFS